MFINTLPMRLSPSDQNVRDAVQNTQKLVGQALQRAHVEAEVELRDKISPAEAAEMRARCKASLSRWWEEAKASGKVPEIFMRASVRLDPRS